MFVVLQRDDCCCCCCARHDTDFCRKTGRLTMSAALFSTMSLDELTYLRALDASCAQFFHHSPPKVKSMAAPMLFDVDDEGPGASSSGYLDLGGGKEMFAVACRSFDAVPWPLSLPPMRNAVTAAIQSFYLPRALEALSRILRPIMLRLVVGACSNGDVVAASTLVESMMSAITHNAAWFESSMLFSRHYHITTDVCDGPARNQDGGMVVGAHTDSGVVTIMFVRDVDTDLAMLEFLRVDPVTNAHHWEDVLSADGDAPWILCRGGGGGGEGALCFLGEMVVPLAEFLVNQQINSISAELRGRITEAIRRVLPSHVGVHRVNPNAAECHRCSSHQPPPGRGPGCRHTYPFQLRADPLLLLAAQATGGACSKFTHKFLVL